MKHVDHADPYPGNILVEKLGPIPDPKELMSRLTFRPAIPDELFSIPKHVRLHHLVKLRDLHIPSPEGIRIAETIDLMLRQGYGYRDPTRPATWSLVGNEFSTPSIACIGAPPLASVVVGHSGVGKTESVRRAFARYPAQVAEHERFPKLVGPHYQVIWLAADVPASGRLADLAANLMIAWDDAFARCFPGFPPRFSAALARERRDGARMLQEWRQVAASHFLGILHLDEVQNFFKLPTLERRRQRKGASADDAAELSLVEDQSLKSILTIANTWQIPLILSGTPDGVSALTKRISNTQRFAATGYHRINEFQSESDPVYEMYITQLARYQYAGKRLPVDTSLRKLILELTAGVPRVICALWIAGHRAAFERAEDSLRLGGCRAFATSVGRGAQRQSR